MDDRELLAIAGSLFDAERERHAIPPISAGRPELGPVEAYRIQEEIVRRRLAAGETVVGWKIGLTSKAMQDQLGVDQPDYGPILSGYMVAEGSAIPIADLIQPRIEAEIAFVLKDSLRGPGVTPDDVLRATAAVAPAIEIIDSRIEGWKITLPDTIADLASSARVALGRSIPVGDIDLRLVGVVVERAGAVVGTGAGAAALGDPAAAVAWAANTLGPLGVTLESGHVIMPGALHASVPANRGDTFLARFDRLGSVSVRFD
jgi:2-keto-4-pentenoate hydratase